MGSVHGARLSGSLTPLFPDRCVLCGADSPGHRARFFVGGDWGAFFFLLWLADGKKSIDAPACPGCVLSARIRSLLRFAVAATVAALVAWILFWIVPAAPAVDHFKALGIVLAAIVPALVWDDVFPPRFGLHTDDENGHIDYRFRNAADAEEFRRLNSAP